MSEPSLLCPFSQPRPEEVISEGGNWLGERMVFGPCLQEKCAMWRTGIVEEARPGLDRKTEFFLVPTGYCGLAGGITGDKE